MKKNLTILILSLSCTFVFGQSKTEQETKDEIQTQQARNTLNQMAGRTVSGGAGGVRPSSGLFTIPIPKEELKGDFYMTKEFMGTDFVLKDGKTMEKVPAKYNIQSNIFAIETDEGDFRSIPGVVVEKFAFNDGVMGKRVFVNINKYPRNPLEYIGFYELLYDSDQVKLFSKTETEILKPSYNIALDIGERAPKVTYRTKFYLYDKEEIKTLKNFSNKNLQLFGSKKSDMKQFIKEEKISFKDRADLVKAIDYYSSISSK